MNYTFRERRKFFDTYGSRSNEQAAGAPLRGVLFTCPCCGYPTLVERAAYEICGLCNWEDDGQDNNNADEIWGGPNKDYSLIEARDNFESYLVMYAPENDMRIGGPDSKREREIKRQLVNAYSQLIEDRTPDEINALWNLVHEAEQALRQEMRRRVSGALYEATPCPYCGATLRTRLAKQCGKCRMDWHDPDKAVKLSEASIEHQRTD
jgi:ribosomal protein L37AE/L43A